MFQSKKLCDKETKHGINENLLLIDPEGKLKSETKRETAAIKCLLTLNTPGPLTHNSPGCFGMFMSFPVSTSIS